MSRQFRDHGCLSDAAALPYAPAPRFSVHPDPTPRLIFEAQRHADTACIYACRLDRQIDSMLAHKPSAEALSPILIAARAARSALNDTIAKLERVS